MSENIQVTLPDGRQAVWSMTLNITDRWGEINMYDYQGKKEAIEELAANHELYQSLLKQMFGEDTFIVQKDGAFGILFEMEYLSKESDGDEGLPSYEDVKRHLLSGLERIQREFQENEICFCVPPDSEIYNGRPAVWAFVKKDGLDDEGRDRLFECLIGL